MNGNQCNAMRSRFKRSAKLRLADHERRFGKAARGNVLKRAHQTHGLAMFKFGHTQGTYPNSGAIFLNKR